MLLSTEQKKRICILARQAWKFLPESKKSQFLRADGGQSDSAAFTLWRRCEQSAAVGRLHLVNSENDEFCILMAHFALLSNSNSVASYWLTRSASYKRRQVYWLIRSACVEGVAFPSYPDAICQAQFSCRLWQASEPQLFKILSTIRNRVNSRRKKSSTSNKQTLLNL